MSRGFLAVGTGTLASRLLGFGRDALLAALLGTSSAGVAFVFAFQLVNVARRLLTEGALNAALVPAWLRIRTAEGTEAAAAFAGRILATLGTGLILATLAMAAAMPLIVGLLAPGFTDDEIRNHAISICRLMLPYLAFAGPVAVLIGLQNARSQYAVTAFAPILFNIVLIAIMLVLIALQTEATTAAYMLAACVGLVGLCQLVMLLGNTSRTAATPLRIELTPDVRSFFGKAWPGMLSGSGPQLLTVGAAIVASGQPAAVSWVYFATRLIELPLGIISAATGAILVPEQARAARDGNAQLAAGTRSRGLLLTLGLALPAAAGLGQLSQPIVQLLFERGAFSSGDTAATAMTLTILALGLPAQALVKAISPAFFAREDTMRPMWATMAGLAAIIPLALLLAPRLGVAGIATAIVMSSSLNAVILGEMARRSGDLLMAAGTGKRLAGIALATGLMLLALWGLRLLLGALHPAPLLAILIPAGLVTYGAVLILTGSLRPADIKRSLAKRAPRS